MTHGLPSLNGEIVINFFSHVEFNTTTTNTNVFPQCVRNIVQLTSYYVQEGFFAENSKAIVNSNCYGRKASCNRSGHEFDIP